MSKNFFDYHPELPRSLPHISEVGTALVKPQQQSYGTSAQQIAQHTNEMQRLSELADAVEHAVTTLIFRIHSTAEPRQQEVLEHNRADLQQFKDELDSLLMQHHDAIKRLQSHT